ncbi:hypothetical protein GQ44DRAFT_716769, partial [Phaeosphaeriaceae sp. PMI808]
MSRRRRKQQSYTRTLITPVSDSAPAATSGRGAVHTLSVSNKVIRMEIAFQRPRLPHLTSATPLVSPIATSMPDDHHSQSSQPAVAAYHWGNPQLNSLSTEYSNPQRFNGHEGAFRTSLPPHPPKLLPIEPRVIYKRS